MTPNHTSDIVEKVIAKRCSTRRFADKPIPREILFKLVQAGIQAPSGSNWQNQRFLIIDDPQEIMRIGKARFVWPYRNANVATTKQRRPGGIIGEAAATIIIFSDSLDNDRRGNGEYYIWEALETQNCSASIENILILATAMGIGTCWVSASDKMNYTRMFSGQSWRELLSNYNIPRHYKLQGIVILGYPTATDEEGFAIGEKKHGATIWQTTERKPVEHYIITENKSAAEIRIALSDKLKVKILATSLRFFQKASAWCDKSIHHIEIEKYLKP